MNDDIMLDEATLRRDDELLDALGRGEPPDGTANDPLLLLLADWRSDLDKNIRPGEPPAVTPEPVRQPVPRPRIRIAVIAAAVAAALGTGATLAAAGAGPGSPLWPITERLYPQHAQSVRAAHDASHMLEQARLAVAEQRPDDAERLLAQAETLISEVDDVIAQRDLFTELDKVRTAFVAAFPDIPLDDPALPLPLPGATPAPGASASPGGSPATPQPSGEPTAEPSPSEDGGVLPPLPTPSLPLLTDLPLLD